MRGVSFLRNRQFAITRAKATCCEREAHEWLTANCHTQPQNSPRGAQVCVTIFTTLNSKAIENRCKKDESQDEERGEE